MTASLLSFPSWRKQLKAVPLIGQVNAWLKARLQERRAEQNLARCRAIARQSGAPCVDEAGLRRALRVRLSQRGKDFLPKPKGGLRIFLAYYVSNWECILPKSLAPFGEVVAFDWRARGYEQGRGDWLEHRDAMNAEMLAAFEEANTKGRIDAVVGYLSGHNTSPETLRRMGEAGACIFNFCFDDKLHLPGRMLGGRDTSPAAIASVVDLNLTNAQESIVKYAAHGGLAMFWPQAAHPDVHRPYDVPFEFDVSFAGSCYGWRPKFITQLQQRGIQVECFGQGWRKGALSDEELIRLYSRSRINLGIGGVAYSRRLVCLKGRDFEAPMSGGLYLTQHNPELEEVFEIGKEIVTYRDASDCAETIKALLAEPERARAIRQAGRARCLREHTYEKRWGEVFELCGLMKEEQ